MRRATLAKIIGHALNAISIHALREEGDFGRIWTASFTTRFLSTPSVRRATNAVQLILEGRSISIHALREEGDTTRPETGNPEKISIHALREEGDDYRLVKLGTLDISIHALREEGDLITRSGQNSTFAFLSTPSVRRATCKRSSREYGNVISIHALREEGDKSEP